MPTEFMDSTQVLNLSSPGTTHENNSYDRKKS